MKNGKLISNGKLKPDLHETPILVRDVSHYLSGLAELHDSGKIGNPELSEGLRQIAAALRHYADCPVHELANTIKPQPASRRKATVRKPKVTLPPNLEYLQQDTIDEILAGDDYTKAQIAELGFQRFGISKSMLLHLRKEDAKRSVRSALENERTLDVISKMARKAGKARAS